MKVFGVSGYSGSGKTTLLERLLPVLIGRGLRVSVLKHAHHGFDIDQPGKDSFRHRMAGAQEVLVSSQARWALMAELRGATELNLDQMLSKLSPCDLVLIEGFKRDPVPKLEVHRAANAKGWIYLSDPNVVALATDAAPPDIDLPRFELNEYDRIADFILEHTRLR